MVPPARSTRGGAEDSIIMMVRDVSCQMFFDFCALNFVLRSTLLKQSTKNKVRSTNLHRYNSISIRFSLSASTLLFEGDVLLKLLTQILQLLSRSVFEFLQSLRIHLLHFLGQPEAFR